MCDGVDGRANLVNEKDALSNPSHTKQKYVLIRCDSSHSCVWWNTHGYRFVPLVDLIVAEEIGGKIGLE